jgi:hypothetical protein
MPSERLPGVFDQLLQIDACLLAEDDMHVVVALRLPKSFAGSLARALAYVAPFSVEGDQLLSAFLQRRRTDPRESPGSD